VGFKVIVQDKAGGPRRVGGVLHDILLKHTPGRHEHSFTLKKQALLEICHTVMPTGMSRPVETSVSYITAKGSILALKLATRSKWK
jgi:hypothetical protein